MDLFYQFIDFFLHLDEHLHVLISNYGDWIYMILFLIIFVETGLVVMPFLPGDSLLFAAGAFCAGVINEAGDVAQLNLWIVLGLLLVAAILGDATNYFIGKNLGLKILKWKIRGKQLIKQKYIDDTHAFFEKHGPKTIIIARFVPIVRTFAPFVAGIGEMTYLHFITYNLVGGVLWVTIFVLGGYFFGNLPFVKDNFSFVVIAIILISVLPAVYEVAKEKMRPSSTEPEY